MTSYTSLLNMVIYVDKHPELLGAIRLAYTLAAAPEAVVGDLAPALPVATLDEGSIDAALEMDLDVPIPLWECKCPGVLTRQAPTLHQMRPMYTSVRSDYEEHGGGGDSAGPRTPTTPAPPPPPLGAFGQQLVAKGVALRRPWAPKAPDDP